MNDTPKTTERPIKEAVQVAIADQPDRTQKMTMPAQPEISRQLVGEIAMDIGKEVAAHIETMYPKAVESASSTFLLSVRNCVYNEIIAALETIDEAAIRQRLKERKRFRRRCRATYRQIRRQEITEDVLQDA